MIRKYRYLLTAAAAVGAAGLLTFAARNDFGLGRNMEIAVNMMRELSLNYVDPVDPDRLMEGAAAGMVSDLDPYTEYIPEEGMQDFELLTTGKYDGMDALFSICQMPPGIPVATVAINGALNAGILAAKIIATNDEALADRLEAYATNMKETVEKKAAKLESIGYSEYLKQMQSK